MSTQQLFITGLHRSGTTLLEKLLHNHPEVAVASQPAPFLYYYVKQAFLDSRKLQRQYPIDPQFPEHDYQPADFTGFLEDFVIPEKELHRPFREMEGYDSQYSPDLLAYGPELRSGTFAEVYRQIAALSRYQTGHKAVRWQGTKEIIGEEFIELLAGEGIKCLLLVRDPRDMLLSTNSGKELGQVRPTLYYLRMWRKSVAFALALDHHPNVLVLRYEDLVQKPEEMLTEISGFLKIDPFPAAATTNGLLTQNGANWQGNSAFGELQKLDSSPVGRYKKHFSPEQIQMVEAFCYPEMKAFGYESQLEIAADYGPELFSRQKEVFAVTHRNFSTDYSHSPVNLQQEMKRAELLLQLEQATKEQAQPYFIFSDAYLALRTALEN